MARCGSAIGSPAKRKGAMEGHRARPVSTGRRGRRASCARRSARRGGVRRIPRRWNKLRTEDLIRIATSGTGVLPTGAIQPGPRQPARRADRHRRQDFILNICIRALDYCPPVDMTFGDYLRALVAADFDLVPRRGTASAWRLDRVVPTVGDLAKRTSGRSLKSSYAGRSSGWENQWLGGTRVECSCSPEVRPIIADALFIRNLWPVCSRHSAEARAIMTTSEPRTISA